MYDVEAAYSGATFIQNFVSIDHVVESLQHDTSAETQRMVSLQANFLFLRKGKHYGGGVNHHQHNYLCFYQNEFL
jgi:hypothetical protein